MWYVGIDWAGDHHDIAVTDEQAAAVARFQVAHSVDGLAQLGERLVAVAGGPSGCQVAIERPDGLLVATLLAWGYAVYPVNPKAVDRYRDRYSMAGAKDDRRDAWVLANVLRTDGARYQPLRVEGEVAAELRVTVRAYHDLVKERVRLSNQLRACLEDYYPLALTLFEHLAAPLTLAFLRDFPDPQAAQGAAAATVRAWCRQHRYGHAAALLAKLGPPQLAQPNAGVVRARRRQMRALVGGLTATVQAAQEHERALADLLGRHPDGGLFLALPGAGVTTAASLLGELGEDRSRLPTADDLRAVAGTAPVTIRSGKQRFVVRRQACSQGLHQALVQFARTSMLQAALGKPDVAWVLALYRARRAAGDGEQAAYRAIANRWAGILWAMWTRHKPYDGPRYQQARAARALPKAGWAHAAPVTARSTITGTHRPPPPPAGRERSRRGGSGVDPPAGPPARLEGGAGVQGVHHRLPPRRTDAVAGGAGRVTPPTGTGGAVSARRRSLTERVHGSRSPCIRPRLRQRMCAIHPYGSVPYE
jgi:transposase